MTQLPLSNGTPFAERNTFFSYFLCDNFARVATSENLILFWTGIKKAQKRKISNTPLLKTSSPVSNFFSKRKQKIENECRLFLAGDVNCNKYDITKNLGEDLFSKRFPESSDCTQNDNKEMPSSMSNLFSRVLKTTRMYMFFQRLPW